MSIFDLLSKLKGSLGGNPDLSGEYKEPVSPPTETAPPQSGLDVFKSKWQSMKPELAYMVAPEEMQRKWGAEKAFERQSGLAKEGWQFQNDLQESIGKRQEGLELLKSRLGREDEAAQRDYIMNLPDDDPRKKAWMLKNVLGPESEISYKQGILGRMSAGGGGRSGGGGGGGSGQPAPDGGSVFGNPPNKIGQKQYLEQVKALNEDPGWVAATTTEPKDEADRVKLLGIVDAQIKKWTVAERFDQSGVTTEALAILRQRRGELGQGQPATPQQAPQRGGLFDNPGGGMINTEIGDLLGRKLGGGGGFLSGLKENYRLK